MTQIMTATEMTDGQIENAVNKLRDAMRKHRSEITSDATQQVLGVKNLGMMMFAPFLECVEMMSKFIVRPVTVNRTRNPQEVLNATGRVQYTTQEVVDSMPKGEGDEVELVFFKPDLSERDGRISDDELKNEFELRGLKPADPISVAALNETDPAFADEKPHGTHWKDTDGNWCCAAFDRWLDERSVDVCHGDYGWDDGWWFVGVRK